MNIKNKALKKFIITIFTVFFLLPGINMAEIQHQKTPTMPSLDKQLAP
jgi:hypothetical protein